MPRKPPTLLKAILSLFLILISYNSALATKHEKSLLLYPTAAFTLNSDGSGMSLVLNGIRPSPPISSGKDWSIKQARPGILHIKNIKWDKAFFELDTNKQTLHMVKDGAFGSLAENRNAEQIVTSIDRVQVQGAPPRIRFYLSSTLAYDFSNKKMDLLIAGMSATSTDEWEAAQAGPGTLQIRHSNWKNIFWETDARFNKATYIESGEFGKKGQPGKDLRIKVDSGRVPFSADNSSLEPQLDFGFNSAGPHNVTEWTAAEKTMFDSLLFSKKYAVLVAPVQVQGNAFDRANRSLITRYLSNAIERQTGLELPDPTVVDKALGHGVRRLSNDAIYRLANMINARIVIRGYAGHDLKENMSLTFFVQVRGADGKLNGGTALTRLDWDKIPFSDGQPPAEAFKDIVQDVVQKLPVKHVSSPKPVQFAKGNLPVPNSISSMVKGGGSALENAYRLQLLGMLYPEDSTGRFVDDFFEREPLFERSLVALEAVSPGSPDYRLLKSRAWFYLRSRPAAIGALGIPRTPEEKAFMAFLNGNLPELEKWAGQITSPIDKLITRIQINDLKLDYDQDLYDKESLKDVILAHKGLEILLARRLTGKSIWDWVPNAIVKKLMDENFPVKGFDIETILRGKMASGDDIKDDEQIDLTIHKHRQTVFQKQPEIIAANGASRPVPLDTLELLYHMGEGTIWKKVRLRMSAQGLYEEAKSLLEKYEKVYAGNLKFMYFKQVTYRQLGRKQNTPIYSKEVSGLEDSLCYHAQEQLNIARCYQDKYYGNDYPRHWVAAEFASDRMRVKEFSVSGFDPAPLGHRARNIIRIDHDLKYTHNSPILLVNYYDELIALGMHKEAEELIRKNESRFSGNPQKVSLMARIATKKGDHEKTAAVYQQSIAQNPRAWENYWGKGNIYLERGEYAKARALFDEYPEFKGDSGGVGFSNRAYQAGYGFLARGRIADARVFLKKSAANDTGAMAEYESRAHLALLDGDLPEAAVSQLQSYRRYKGFDSIDEYMAILHVLGKREEARAILNSVDLSNNLPYSAFIGFRMDGVDEDEQLRRLKEDGSQSISGYAAFKYAVLGMMDRAPDDKDIMRLMNLGNADTASSKSARLLGRAYYFLRKQNFKAIYPELQKYGQEDMRPLLRQNKEFVMPEYREYRILLPYYSYAAAKTGNSAEAIRLLNDVKAVFGEDYQYHLSMAFINGIEGRHADALKSLESVRSATSSLLSTPIPQWYKLVDACEWLYKESGRVEYRNMALDLAKAYQKIMPLWAWAYAVEAKYAAPGPERTMALALTLYLDKKSERISGIPESEKAAALKWLEKNNPFLKKAKKVGGL